MENTKEMVGFISGVTYAIQTEDVEKRMIEINFLCVHKDNRAKSFAPLLIEEVARRANLKSIFQAFYTSGTVLPTPFGQAKYYHRLINTQKLLDVGFSYIPHGWDYKRYSRVHSVPETGPLTPTHKIRQMTKADANPVRDILNTYLKNFAIRQVWSKKEVEHYLIPRKELIYSYVVEDSAKKVVGFFSFYA